MGQHKSKTLSLDFVKQYSKDPDLAWEMIEKNQTVETLPLPLLTANSPRLAGHTRFVFISDTHSRTSNIKPLPEGDVLIHAGDFTMAGTPEEVEKFNDFLGSLPHEHKIVIAGNHDITFDTEGYQDIWRNYGSVKHNPAEVKKLLTNCVYLEDEEVTIQGFRIYGSPWSAKCGSWAFMRSRGEPLWEKWKNIPEGIDVLVTHGPPLGHGDLVNMFVKHRAGCLGLLYTVQSLVKPKYHVFGHIHEGYGVTTDGVTTFINASVCTQQYNCTNEPIAVDVPNKV